METLSEAAGVADFLGLPGLAGFRVSPVRFKAATMALGVVSKRADSSRRDNWSLSATNCGQLARASKLPTQLTSLVSL